MNDLSRAMTLPKAKRVALVSLPVALSLLVWVFSPRYFPAFGDRPVTWLGIPVGDLLMAAAVGWGLLGGVLVARGRQPYAFAIGFLVFTIPACFAILFAPAVILILQNLG